MINYINKLGKSNRLKIKEDNCGFLRKVKKKLFPGTETDKIYIGTYIDKNTYYITSRDKTIYIL